MAVVTRFPTANTSGIGNWTNPNNGRADDGVDATISGVGAGTKYQNFGFDAAIPAGATIDAVIITVELGITGGNAAGIVYTQPIVGGANQTERVHGQEPQTYPFTNPMNHTSDRSWTRADLLDGTFEVRVRFDNFFTSDAAQFDYIKVAVTYTGDPPPVTKFPTTNAVWDDGTNTGPFTNPENAYADDGVDTVGSAAPFSTVGSMWGTFGFDAVIPFGATIDAVKIIVECGTAGSATHQVRGRVSGVDQAAHNVGTGLSYPTVVTLDITADRSWTRANLLDGVFEAVWMRTGVASPTSVTGDYIKVEVTYSNPPLIMLLHESGRF